MKAAVIIPVYNQERHLRRALDSLAAQTCRDFIAVFVDDGSTDASAAILAADGALVITQRNGGVSSARNAGLAAALAMPDVTHVMFLDADDAYHPDCVAVALAEAERAPEAVIEWDYSSRTEIGSPNIWCKCYPRACVDDVRFFEGTNVAEDIAFNFEVDLRHHPPLVHVRRQLYFYSDNQVSEMHRSLRASDFERRTAVLEYMVEKASSDPKALQRLTRGDLPDLLKQFFRQLRRVVVSDRAAAERIFRAELASLRRRGLLRPRSGRFKDLKYYLKFLVLSHVR